MPDSRDDFEAAWARIVDDLTSGGPSADTDGAGAHGPADGAPHPGPPADAQTPPPPVEQPPAPDAARDAGLAGLFEPLRRREPPPEEFVDNWEDEGHFVPPPPPEIPEGTPVKRLAWAGVIGGPVVLLLIALTGWQPPGIVGVSAGLACIAGFATLVWHLPEGREDGWDDGSRL